MELRKLQAQVGEWARKNFPHGRNYHPLLGAVEEMGELAHAHLKAEQGIRINEDHEAAIKDAIGDIVIYLADYCERNLVDFAEAVEGSWNEVKKRDWINNKETGA